MKTTAMTHRSLRISTKYSCANYVKKDWFIASSNTFKRLPGEPIAYWVSDHIAALFQFPASGGIVDLREGIHTGDNEQFLRLWHRLKEKIFALGCFSDEDVDDKSGFRTTKEEPTGNGMEIMS